MNVLQCFRGDGHSRATGRKLILVWSLIEEDGIPDVRAHMNRFEFE